jgi:hypothetical protein
LIFLVIFCSFCSLGIENIFDNRTAHIPRHSTAFSIPTWQFFENMGLKGIGRLFGLNAKKDCLCSDLGYFKATYPQRAQRKPLVAFLIPLEDFLAQKYGNRRDQAIHREARYKNWRGIIPQMTKEFPIASEATVKDISEKRSKDIIDGTLEEYWVKIFGLHATACQMDWIEQSKDRNKAVYPASRLHSAENSKARRFHSSDDIASLDFCESAPVSTSFPTSESRAMPAGLGFSVFSVQWQASFLPA